MHAPCCHLPLMTIATCACLSLHLGRRRRRRNGRRTAGRDRGGFRRLAAAVRRLEGPAYLPHSGLRVPRQWRRAHTRARARARTHTHTHTRARCHVRPCRRCDRARVLNGRPNLHTVSRLPAAPFSNRGHNVEITWARHAFTSARHLCLPPGPRDGGGRAWAPNCGARESLARPPSSPKARTKAGFCTHGAAAVAVGSWRAWSGATRARCPAAAPAGACAKRPTR